MIVELCRSDCLVRRMEKDMYDIPIFIAAAKNIRLGVTPMPDIRALSEEEATFLVKLIKDDAFFDFWDSVKELSIEHIRALVAYERADSAYKEAERIYLEAKRQRLIAIQKLNRFSESVNCGE